MKTQPITTVGKDELPVLDNGIIDELKQLVDEDDPDFLNEIINGYLENAAENIKVIAEHVHTPDAEIVMRMAHTLKGSSRNVGAVAMAHYSSELESLSRLGNYPEKTGDLLRQLEVELERVKNEMQSLLTPV